MLLAPDNERKPSKTNQYDESILIDWLHLPGLFSRLEAQVAQKSPEDWIWPFDHRGYNDLFDKHCQQSGVSALGVHPY